MNDTLWQDVSKYNGGQEIMNGEIGKLCGVRFIESSNVGTVSNGADTPVMLHQTMIIGADAYGVVDIGGTSAPQMIIKGVESGGTADPLNQRSTVGWKALFAAVRLQELAMVRIEHAVTA
jgi:N4-gp56 family major capsid protein